MRTMRSIWMIVMMVVAGFAGAAFGQGGAGRYYNPNTQVAVKGTVEKATNVTNGQGWYGVHLTLKSQDRTYDVRLGPSDFISQSNFTFAAGDQVEIWGSQIGPNTGDTIIIARAIEKNGQTLTLRDADGFPAWAGMGMRRSYGRGYGGGYGRGYGGCPGCGCDRY